MAYVLVFGGSRVLLILCCSRYFLRASNLGLLSLAKRSDRPFLEVASSESGRLSNSTRMVEYSSLVTNSCNSLTGRVVHFEDMKELGEKCARSIASICTSTFGSWVRWRVVLVIDIVTPMSSMSPPLRRGIVLIYVKINEPKSCTKKKGHSPIARRLSAPAARRRHLIRTIPSIGGSTLRNSSAVWKSRNAPFARRMATRVSKGAHERCWPEPSCNDCSGL